MSITDELREWYKDRLFMGNGWAEIDAIADRIDAAHRSALEKLAAQLDESEDGWVRLPVDADGVPIHVGDRLTDGEYRFTVCELATFGDGSWSIRNEDGNAWAACDVTHRMPTVEEVLREMLSKYDELRLGPSAFDPFELMAEYAAKLRLAGDAE